MAAICQFQEDVDHGRIALRVPRSFWTPCHLGRSCRWLGHVPFVFWLLDAARPRLVVQLGPGPANAYLAFCQAIEPALASAQAASRSRMEKATDSMAMTMPVR